MPRAVWKNTVIADAPADKCESVEGIVYFPPDALSRDHFNDSATRTTCGRKGQASYLDVVVGEASNLDAAWYYPEPLEEAKHIAGYVAFWKGVEVEA